MTTTTAITATASGRVTGDEVSQLATQEYGRLLAVLRSLEDADWARPTDCALWTVRDVVAHLVGTAESSSLREQTRVALKGLRRARREHTSHLDGINAVQVSERADLGPTELVERLDRAAPRFVAFRRRFPRPMRAVKVPAPAGRLSMGHLMDVVYTRDVWIHRVDISRATGRAMELTAEHDGRLVAGVAAEWARTHGRPVTLRLEGPAGGIHEFGTGGEEIRVDAVEFCRIVAGRTPGTGLLATPVNF